MYIKSLSITEVISGFKIFVQNKAISFVQSWKIDCKDKYSILL